MYKTKFLLPTLSLIIGVLTLAGWILDINILQRGIASSVAMNPLTAMGFILLGIETLRWYSGNHSVLLDRTGQLIVGIVTIAATLKLSDVYLNTSFAIDQLFFTEKLDQDVLYPSRVAPNSALCFLLLGCAMQLIRSRSNKAILTAQIFTLAASAISFIAMVGYLYGVSRFNGYAALIPMAFNTSMAFIFLATGILFIHPDRGFMHVLTSEGPARKVATILLPATIVIPFLLSWISLKAEQAGIYNLRFDASTTVVLDVIVFLALSYISIRSLFFSDIQRQQILAQLRQSEQRYRLLVDGVKDVAIFMLDKHGRIVTWNQGAERLKGYAADEIIGRHFSVFYPPDAVVAGKAEFVLAEAREHGRIEDEGWRVRKDSSMFWAHVVITTLYSDNGDIQGFSKITRDITLRKQAEKTLLEAKEQAEKASAAKDAFLATMSHEIRTPLTGMLGMLELLSMTNLDDKQTKTLHTARQSGRNLLRIVSDILDWSKIEEGKLELSLQSTAISQVLREVVDTYSGVASAKNLALWQSVDPLLSPAHIVDPFRLSQILHNFVSNAIKFTPSGGGIELRAELLGQVESGEKIRFSVKDTGIGIPKNVQKKLFERYRQEHVDTARMYGGTGLGLAICRRLADLMDGQVELVSEPGQGATFSITLILPVSGAPGVAIQKHYLEVEQRAVKPLFASSTDAPLVLAVDDHPINCDLLMNQISILGLRVESAPNGKVALAMWREKHHALVITDCHMPEMDGYAFTKEVRKIERAEKRQHTPIIAWTANALADESQRCQVSGMDDLLVKPAGIIQIKNTLAKWLSITGMDDEQFTTPPSSESLQESAPIDFTVLEQSVPDATAQINVLHNFKTHVHAGYADLLTYLVQEDLPSLQSTSHRMKGSCQMVGAKHIANACAMIELAARSEDIAGMHKGKAALDDAIEQFDSYILTLEHSRQEPTERIGSYDENS